MIKTILNVTFALFETLLSGLISYLIFKNENKYKYGIIWK